MQGHLIVKRIGWGLVLLALLPFVIGVSLSTSDAFVLSDVGRSGTFEITEEEAGMVIIVFDEYGVIECSEYEFNVFDENQQRIMFTKTDCEKWWEESTYQFTSEALPPGMYDFDASDDVEILAVKGDLETYMENYVIGEFLSSLGCGICCFGIVAVVGSSRMGAATAYGAENQVILMGQGQPVEAIPVVAEPVQSSMYQEIVRQAETVVSTVEDAEDEASPNGSFWGGITED
jgi:hypothetical protein